MICFKKTIKNEILEVYLPINAQCSKFGTHCQMRFNITCNLNFHTNEIYFQSA